MLEKDLFIRIGFTDSMISECEKYKDFSENTIYPYAKLYMSDEIELNEVFKAWFKEVRIALLVGVTLAIVNGAQVMMQYGNLMLAIVIGCTIIFTVILAKSLGCILPMIAKRLNLDPAIMASPMITTIVDACSILIYFNIAVILFGI